MFVSAYDVKMSLAYKLYREILNTHPVMVEADDCWDLKAAEPEESVGTEQLDGKAYFKSGSSKMLGW